ncbi:MAG: hypothetical protein U0R81_01205 [Mycobacterium sp.]
MSRNDPQLPERRSALRALGALGLLGSAALLGWRRAPDGHRRGSPEVQLADNGMMDGANMGQYMEMFARHNEIHRTVTDIPGGVRATTESNSPELTAQLQAHVSDVYSRLNRGFPIMGAATSATLPVLVRNAANYRRHLTLTPTGVSIEETSDDPALTQVIRDHAREVSGFVADGMPAALQPMMGGMGMGTGGMGMGGMGMGPGGMGGMGGGMGHS